jgi:cyclopropane-fatty-acyl-phospholipid synthase
MNTPADRAASLRKLLAHVREAYGLDFGFVLWDGSTVPADLPGDALAVVIADEGVVAALLRRRKIDTLGDLWVTARLDLRNGTVLDLLSRPPKVRSREFRKRLDRWLALRVLAKFLLLPAGGPWPLRDSLHGSPTRSSGNEVENKENIQYHYDVSNAFYALFLDPEMVYSCGYFTDWSNDLATAQRDKLDITCRKLRLQPGETLLDLGCGWGALVCHAAQHYGVHAHGVTLAQQQFDYAKEKVARLGLQDRVTLELRDYSTLQGSYDKIASLGMFEHVGIAYHPAYFATIHRLLKPRGFYLHHAITRRAKMSERAFNRRAPEYVALTRYIFPGGEVDHLGMSIRNLESHGFEVRDVEGWREHYRMTCRAWHDRLVANQAAAVREIGSVKTRLWVAYLAGCAVGFEGASVGIFQTLAVKRQRGLTDLPPTRADLYR